MTSLPVAERPTASHAFHLRSDLPLVAGAGIAGLATAAALAAAGTPCQVVERATELSEVGAGIQLGPNAVRRLQRMGLLTALQGVAAQPEAVIARDAASGAERGRLALDGAFCERYGAPYHTVHRADLHALLLQAVRLAGVEVFTSQGLRRVQIEGDTPWLQFETGDRLQVPWLVGCDGLWSTVRASLGLHSPPVPTGHVALRSLLPAADVPRGVARQAVTVWLGPRLHVVGYPVRRGELYNLVAFAHGSPAGMAQADEATRQLWNREAPRHWYADRLPRLAAPLRALLEAPSQWALWALHDREPMASAAEMVCGPVLLLGDAAHPMRPYLAQGAAMALEDAVELADQIQVARGQVRQALTRTAELRWQRCARVQAQSRRNGRVFHATGPLAVARNAALALVAPRLMDTPWLYGG